MSPKFKFTGWGQCPYCGIVAGQPAAQLVRMAEINQYGLNIGRIAACPVCGRYSQEIGNEQELKIIYKLPKSARAAIAELISAKELSGDSFRVMMAGEMDQTKRYIELRYEKLQLGASVSVSECLESTVGFEYDPSPAGKIEVVSPVSITMSLPDTIGLSLRKLTRAGFIPVSATDNQHNHQYDYLSDQTICHFSWDTGGKLLDFPHSH